MTELLTKLCIESSAERASSLHLRLVPTYTSSLQSSKIIHNNRKFEISCVIVSEL